MPHDKLLDLKDENTRGNMASPKPLDPQTGGKIIFRKRKLRAAWYWMTENRLKSAAILLGMIAFAAAGYIILHKPVKPAVTESEQSVTTDRNLGKKPEGHSRVTFFFTQPLKGSLAMPEHWEGRYRLENGDRTATFSYIVNPVTVTPIFTLTIYPQKEWGALANKDGKIILTQEDFVFVYRKNANNPYTGTDKDIYGKMLIEADEIVSTFKAAKL